MIIDNDRFKADIPKRGSWCEKITVETFKKMLRYVRALNFYNRYYRYHFKVLKNSFERVFLTFKNTNQIKIVKRQL